MSVYTDEAARSARAMFVKGLSVHQVRRALERQHPRADGWTLNDVHRAVNQSQRQVERERALA